MKASSRAMPLYVGVMMLLLSVTAHSTAQPPVEMWQEGRLAGFARIGEDGAAMRIPGMARPLEDAVPAPVAPPPLRVVMLAPDEAHSAVAEAGLLWGEQLEVVADPGDLARALAEPPDAVIALASPAAVLPALGPETVVFCALETYADLRGLEVRRHQVRQRPTMRITALADLLAGLEVGHEVPWYGTEENDEFFHHSLPAEGLPAQARVLAVSTVDDGPVLLEEALAGGGRLIAWDLEAPNGLPGYDRGSKHKWFFPARALDPRPFYGKYYPRKLSFEEYMDELHALAERFPGRLEVTQVGEGAAGDPVMAARVGNPDAPRFVFTGVLHGGEVMGAYALLRLLEVLLENPGDDPRIADLMERYGVEVLPIVNVWGYTQGKQVNSRDCDLNRNFDYLWEEYAGDGGWRAVYAPEVLRGEAPFSEGEAAAVRDRILDGEVAGFMDIHQHGMQHGHMLMMSHRPVQQAREAQLFLGELLNERLRGRYLFGERPLEVRQSTSGSARPFSQNWVSSQGIVACTFETVGRFEDSLLITDIVTNAILNFMWVLDTRGEMLRPGAVGRLRILEREPNGRIDALCLRADGNAPTDDEYRRHAQGEDLPHVMYLNAADFDPERSVTAADGRAWHVVDDPDALSGTHVVSRGHRITSEPLMPLEYALPEVTQAPPGPWRLWARVIFPDVDADSFFHQLSDDGGETWVPPTPQDAHAIGWEQPQEYAWVGGR